MGDHQYNKFEYEDITFSLVRTTEAGDPHLSDLIYGNQENLASHVFSYYRFGLLTSTVSKLVQSLD